MPRSLKGILEDLTYFPGAVSDDDRLLVAQVIQRLPKRIREKVLDSRNGASFVLSNPGVLGNTMELYFPTEDYLGARWFIFLCLSHRLSRKRKMTVIAHEIAHFVLKRSTGSGREAEKAADNLCQKWGFGRTYKNYD